MMQGWISVKDKLPEPMTRVLVWINNTVPHEAISYLRNGRWQASYMAVISPTTDVEYWIPLPGSPEGWGECGEVKDE